MPTFQKFQSPPEAPGVSGSKLWVSRNTSPMPHYPEGFVNTDFIDCPPGREKANATWGIVQILQLAQTSWQSGRAKLLPCSLAVLP